MRFRIIFLQQSLLAVSLFAISLAPAHSSDITSLGYTGHEHDDEVGLINMNARLYDPVLGRFITADPVVAIPDGQGINRYAYAGNNPLRYTDPSGYAQTETWNGTYNSALQPRGYADYQSCPIGVCLIPTGPAVFTPAFIYDPYEGLNMFDDTEVMFNDYEYDHPSTAQASDAFDYVFLPYDGSYDMVEPTSFTFTEEDLAWFGIEHLVNEDGTPLTIGNAGTTEARNYVDVDTVPLPSSTLDYTPATDYTPADDLWVPGSTSSLSDAGGTGALDYCDYSVGMCTPPPPELRSWSSENVTQIDGVDRLADPVMGGGIAGTDNGRVEQFFTGPGEGLALTVGGGYWGLGGAKRGIAGNPGSNSQDLREGKHPVVESVTMRYYAESLFGGTRLSDRDYRFARAVDPSASSVTAVSGGRTITVPPPNPNTITIWTIQTRSAIAVFSIAPTTNY